MTRTARTARITAGTLALGLLVVPLTGCAPEPGTTGSGTLGEGMPDPKDKQESEGDSWPEKNPDEVYEKHQELPADFPAGFVIPEGAVIDNAGSSGLGKWFVVLRAADASTADALWAQIIEAGAFAASDETTNAEGGIVATLTSTELEVAGMTIPEPSGEVLLTYDITSRVL